MNFETSNFDLDGFFCTPTSRPIGINFLSDFFGSKKLTGPENLRVHTTIAPPESTAQAIGNHYAFVQELYMLVKSMTCLLNYNIVLLMATRNRAIKPVEVGSLSHHLRFFYIPGGFIMFIPSKLQCMNSRNLHDKPATCVSHRTFLTANNKQIGVVNAIVRWLRYIRRRWNFSRQSPVVLLGVVLLRRRQSSPKWIRFQCDFLKHYKSGCLFVDLFRPIKYLVNGQFGFYKSFGSQCWGGLRPTQPPFRVKSYIDVLASHTHCISAIVLRSQFSVFEVEKTRIVNTRWAPTYGLSQIPNTQPGNLWNRVISGLTSYI